MTVNSSALTATRELLTHAKTAARGITALPFTRLIYRTPS